MGPRRSAHPCITAALRCTARLSCGSGALRSASALRTLPASVRRLRPPHSGKVAASLPRGRGSLTLHGLTANEPSEVLTGEVHAKLGDSQHRVATTDRARNQAQPRPAAPNPKRNVAIRTVAFLAGTDRHHVGPDVGAPRSLGRDPKPATNSRHFPIAPGTRRRPAGQQIVDGLVSGLTRTKFDIRSGFADEARRLLDTAWCTARLIPPTFRVAQLRDPGECSDANSAQTGPRSRPTNPRAGTLAAHRRPDADPEQLTVVNGKAGERLTAEVAAQAPWRCGTGRGGGRAGQSHRCQIHRR